jgi:hypothetical protein
MSSSNLGGSAGMLYLMGDEREKRRILISLIFTLGIT